MFRHAPLGETSLIGVVGNAVADLSYEVSALPRSGETILASASNLDVGGKGLNQAIVSHRAGSRVRLVAAIGDDAHGALIETRMKDDGIDVADLVLRVGSSDHSIIYVGPGGENCIVSTTGMAASLTVEEADPLLEALGLADTLLLQGNLSARLTSACLERARAKNVRTIVNSAPITFDYSELWPLIDVAIVNQVEGNVLTGETEPEAIVAQLRAFGVDLAVVTLGKAGAFLSHSDRSIPIDAPTSRCVDSTGAGDVFCGVLAAALDQEIAPEAACRWAVAAASRSVSRRGTIGSFPSGEAFQDLRPR